MSRVRLQVIVNANFPGEIPPLDLEGIKEDVEYAVREFGGTGVIVATLEEKTDD